MVKVPFTMAVSCTVANFLLNTGRVLRAIELCKECLIVLHSQAQTMDRSLANNSLRVIYNTITNAYSAMNDYASGEKCLRELLNLYQDSIESVEKGHLHFRLAKVLYDQNKFVEAIAFSKLAISIMETNGDQQGEALCYEHLGVLYHLIGKYDKCRKHLQKALAQYKEWLQTIRSNKLRKTTIIVPYPG